MQGPTQHHGSEEELESYSMGRLGAFRTAAIEEHLLICRQCTEGLLAIETFSYIHYTRQGPVYSRITKLKSGAFFARHWGRDLDGGKEFRTRSGAKGYLTRSFSQMFPEHVCSSRCGWTSPATQTPHGAFR